MTMISYTMRGLLKLSKFQAASFSVASSKIREYDIVIVGGGLVGAAVGCGLAKHPMTSSLRVAIVDAASSIGETQIMPQNAIPDPRVSAISPATVSFLKGIGTWEHIKKCRHAPFQSMQVWDFTGLGYTRYSAADVGTSFLGYVVENSVLISALRSCLQESTFIETICPARVKTAVFPSPLKSGILENDLQERITNKGPGTEKQATENAQNTWARVDLEDGESLFARLVIGADGPRSKVRSMAEIDTLRWDYKQQALICTVETEREHLTAWQRFLPTGPLAILPMGELYSNIVWSTTPERALDLKTMSDEEFLTAVNQALVEEYGPFPSSTFSQFLGDKFSSIFGGVPSASESFEIPPYVTKVLTERLSFPLSLCHAYKYTSSRLALVGDAAHTVHPLAGQGVNLGFGDAASLVNILAEGIKHGADIGEVLLLEKYEKERMLANTPMIAILDSFQRVFSADFGPVNLARAAAFQAVQLLGPLKKRVISFAMGKGGLLNSM